MPVMPCQRDGEEGWKWGEEGMCYLPSEEGGDDAAREKAAAQGRAIQSRQAEFGRVQEYARIIDVPVFRAGKFYPRNTGGQPVEVAPEELDEMLESYRECQDILKQAILTGEYAGNDFKGATPVPGFLNVWHQDELAETMKNAVKDASLSFNKKLVDGVEWLTATFENVPTEIAKFIKNKLPYRSIEILPKLYHPGKQKWFRNVPRSVAFLDPLTQPAVSGQSSQLTVEFAQENAVHTYIFQFDQSKINDGGTPMKDETKQNQTPEKQPEEKTPVVNQEQEVKSDGTPSKALEFEQRMKALEMQVKEANQRAENASKEAQTEREKREKTELAQFFQTLKTDHHLAPAAVEAIQAYHDAGVQVMEFEQRKETFSAFIDSLLNMAASNALFVPVGEFAAGEGKEDVAQMTALQAFEQFQKDNPGSGYAEFCEANPHYVMGGK